MADSTQVVFVDTETTGLDPDQHQIWDIGLIVDDREYQWFLEVDLGRADARALEIGRFHERHPRGHNPGKVDKPTNQTYQVAREVAKLTPGKHLVGAVPSFDEERLRKLLRANGACPEWHYHLIDVEALAVGWLAAEGRTLIELPWDSEALSRAIGIEPTDRHEALADARWAKAIYEAILLSDTPSRAGGSA